MTNEEKIRELEAAIRKTKSPYLKRDYMKAIKRLRRKAYAENSYRMERVRI